MPEKESICLGVSYKRNRLNKTIRTKFFKSHKEMRKWYRKARKEMERLYIKEVRLYDMEGDALQGYVIIPKSALGIRRTR